MYRTRCEPPVIFRGRRYTIRLTRSIANEKILSINPIALYRINYRVGKKRSLREEASAIWADAEIESPNGRRIALLFVSRRAEAREIIDRQLFDSHRWDARFVSAEGYFQFPFRGNPRRNRFSFAPTSEVEPLCCRLRKRYFRRKEKNNTLFHSRDRSIPTIISLF